MAAACECCQNDCGCLCLVTLRKLDTLRAELGRLRDVVCEEDAASIGRVLAETADATPAASAARSAEEITADLASGTLATGDRLMEHITRAKLVNGWPYTPAERAWLQGLVDARRAASAGEG